MDNLAHTLAGAALGQAGLKKKTGLGLATLMIAANLPDLDAFGLIFGENLAWRRGWTHGPLALLILPPFLALAMWAFDRWQTRRGTRPAARPPLNMPWLLALAYIGILSHPLLDFLNTYGIRCLMPFSDRWFYGDAVFIIDVWIWAMLGLGVWLTWRRERKHQPSPATPARTALVIVSVYCLLMGTSAIVAEHLATREAETRGLGTPQRVVASPVPLNPFHRRLALDFGHQYGFGDLYWLPTPHVELEQALMPTNMDDAAIARAAAHSKQLADFLYWSRLPFAVVQRENGIATVTIGDARYGPRPDNSRFTLTVTVPDESR
jgi:inner membrane protein